MSHWIDNHMWAPALFAIGLTSFLMWLGSRVDLPVDSVEQDNYPWFS